MQRWYADPLFDGASTKPVPPAKDRTLRTVFTHDHFGPSTHQQAGLYAGLVVEPKGSQWYNNEQVGQQPFGGTAANGTMIPSRKVTGADGKTITDGGPTTWQAVITPPSSSGTPAFREFLLEVQDSTLAYLPFPKFTPVPPGTGFCSNNPANSCTPATWNTPEDTRKCGYKYATCNLIPGINEKRGRARDPHGGNVGERGHLAGSAIDLPSELT